MSEKITVGKVWKKKSVHSGGGVEKRYAQFKNKNVANTVYGYEDNVLEGDSFYSLRKE